MREMERVCVGSRWRKEEWMYGRKEESIALTVPKPSKHIVLSRVKNFWSTKQKDTSRIHNS